MNRNSTPNPSSFTNQNEEGSRTLDSIRALHEGNRDAWNRTAKAGYCSATEQHVETLREGDTGLFEAELRLLGDLSTSERAIHLQCSHGFDALSLLSLGAQEVIGIDISEEMLVHARQKSEALGANAKWIRSDVLDTPHELDGTADTERECDVFST